VIALSLSCLLSVNYDEYVPMSLTDSDEGYLCDPPNF